MKPNQTAGGATSTKDQLNRAVKQWVRSIFRKKRMYCCLKELPLELWQIGLCSCLGSPQMPISLSEEEASVSQALKWKNQRNCKNLMRTLLRPALRVWHNTSWHFLSSLSTAFISTAYTWGMEWKFRLETSTTGRKSASRWTLLIRLNTKRNKKSNKKDLWTATVKGIILLYRLRNAPAIIVCCFFNSFLLYVKTDFLYLLLSSM